MYINRIPSEKKALQVLVMAFLKNDLLTFEYFNFHRNKQTRTEV